MPVSTHVQVSDDSGVIAGSYLLGCVFRFATLRSGYSATVGLWVTTLRFAVEGNRGIVLVAPWESAE
jgi:hypothetical protein